MYIFPELIDLGLEEGQKWPSEDHKALAQTIGIQNPKVTNRSHLITIVQAICKLTNDELDTMTWGRLVQKYPELSNYLNLIYEN